MGALSNIAKKNYLRLLHASPVTAAMAYHPLAARHNARLRICGDYVDLIRGDRAIRMAHRHQFYIPTVLAEFDYYHSSVRPLAVAGRAVVDFSTPRFHQVLGYDAHPIMTPAIAEPLSTAEQYLDHGRLTGGETVLDLGAYSALTSIVFDRAVGAGGRVVAVDADPGNLECIRQNLNLYKAVSGRTIDLLYAAVWKETGVVEFSAEGSMGSSATALVGEGRSKTTQVPAVTLGAIVERFGLDRVDFIKCDIEGAEAVIFDQPEFFGRFRPRMIVEVHEVGGELTAQACRTSLGRFGYVCKEVPQAGSSLPLLECLPG